MKWIKWRGRKIRITWLPQHILTEIREMRIKRICRDKPSRLFYSKKLKTYLYPKLSPPESGDISYMLSEMVRGGLHYGYELFPGEEGNHSHAFDGVLQDVYEYPFWFVPRDEAEFSKQELKMIKQVRSSSLAELEFYPDLRWEKLNDLVTNTAWDSTGKQTEIKNQEALDKLMAHLGLDKK
jgi:hypothetical protein